MEQFPTEESCLRILFTLLKRKTRSVTLSDILEITPIDKRYPDLIMIAFSFLASSIIRLTILDLFLSSRKKYSNFVAQRPMIIFFSSSSPILAAVQETPLSNDPAICLHLEREKSIWGPLRRFSG